MILYGGVNVEKHHNTRENRDNSKLSTNAEKNNIRYNTQHLNNWQR